MNVTTGQWSLGKSMTLFGALPLHGFSPKLRWGSGSNNVQQTVPPIDALTAYIGTSATIATSLANDVDPAVAAAKGKDVAFVFVNAYVPLSF